MDVLAEITGIKYSPFLCRELKTYDLDSFHYALSKDATFILRLDSSNSISVSWWVSPKRTRSYPYERVYNSLSFQGKKVTIIPVMKDEGKTGDRDFLQWDTISLMSLLGVYTIIAYYCIADKSQRFATKITNQIFDVEYVKGQIHNLLSYQSDALHWNLSQIDNIGKIGRKSLDCYSKISSEIGIEMHSEKAAEKRIQELLKGKEHFMNLSRELAKKAQRRESVTTQPKEKLSGQKGILTIKNYLGGYYYFTCDEIYISEKEIYLIECKHSKKGLLPSWNDIKDGLLKMILFTNLKSVKAQEKTYKPVAVLKLTSNEIFSLDLLIKSQIELLKTLNTEANENNFQVLINNKNLKEINL